MRMGIGSNQPSLGGTTSRAAKGRLVPTRKHCSIIATASSLLAISATYAAVTAESASATPINNGVDQLVRIEY